MTINELVDAWRANNAINLELLGMCTPEDLELKPGKGKTIRSNFVHIIGVRRNWIEEKMKKESEMIPKLDWKVSSIESLREGLEVSSALMQALFEKREERTKPDRWTTPLFFAYCVAHEAHHRSQIEIALRINGREPSDDTLMNLWNWPKK